MKTLKTLHLTDRAKWRAWLKKHHTAENEVWLVYYKKHTGKPRIPYDDAVEEALCFGWIDSIVKRIDDETYAQKFTPRTNNSKWSDLNVRRAKKLIKDGRMTEAGLAKIDPEILRRKSKSKPRSKKDRLIVPAFIRQALMATWKAWENFNNLAPSYRRHYIGWISDAKREETRRRRLKEAVALLARGEKLGLK